MLHQYHLGSPELELKSDIVGRSPIYLYCPVEAKTAYYSESLPELLTHPDVKKKHSAKGISFLLQSGVVPPPCTAYQDIYLIGTGHTCRLSSSTKYIQIDFEDDFPFTKAKRLTHPKNAEDSSYFLECIAKDVERRVDDSRPTFLFHSAGKDSNTVALALAEAGWQDKVVLVCQSSAGVSDESEISTQIAKRLGFKNAVLKPVTHLEKHHFEATERFFNNIPLPCLDELSLVYSWFPLQLPELEGANIIDGSGNDLYFSLLPTRKDERTVKSAGFFSRFNSVRKRIPSNKALMSLFSTRAERFGLRGFSFRDSQSIFSECMDAYGFWYSQSQLYEGKELVDFKTDIKGRLVAAEMHIRKVRNAADAWGSNLILPLAAAEVANYCLSLDEQRIVDSKNRRNKVFIRELLKNKLDLDSDALGKMGFTYDSKTLINNNWGWCTDTIKNCKLWEHDNVCRLISRLEPAIKSRKSHESRLLFRLFLISAWYSNHF